MGTLYAWLKPGVRVEKCTSGEHTLHRMVAGEQRVVYCRDGRYYLQVGDDYLNDITLPKDIRGRVEEFTFHGTFPSIPRRTCGRYSLGDNCILHTFAEAEVTRDIVFGELGHRITIRGTDAAMVQELYRAIRSGVGIQCLVMNYEAEEDGFTPRERGYKTRIAQLESDLEQTRQVSNRLCEGLSKVSTLATRLLDRPWWRQLCPARAVGRQLKNALPD